MHSLVAAALTGGLFGSALAISGVANPRIILDQLQFTNFHMLLTFLTASACSAPVFAVANYAKFATIPRKSSTTYGWANRFDGNVTGGLLLGLGMGLTGACPGTMVVQAAGGVRNAWLMLIGALLGGISYVKWSRSHPKQATSSFDPERTSSTAKGKDTSQRLLLGYEVIAILTIIAVNELAPRAYEDIGNFFWALLKVERLPSAQNSIFLASVFAGAKMIMHLMPFTSAGLQTSGSASTFSSLLSGFLLVFGARLGGGCTTGHGISGMSSLGVSSFVSVSSMFGGGIALTMLSP
ncbi:hypothetical protein D0859_12674 [Hortaea werneckii]|uniref:Sulphur transport domain-containing protein n=1 Tax=Hortaea werneckii TaxID=91943 RepID=A0A3M7ID01_HORWE|nr:hypothetical protein D0859_12674 [Hortaea werneckii]